MLDFAAERRLDGVCQPGTQQVSQASSGGDLQNVIACANADTSNLYRIEITENIQLTIGAGVSPNGLQVSGGAKLAIVGAKPSSLYTEIRGQAEAGGYRILKVPVGAEVLLEKLDLHDGHALAPLNGGAIANYGSLSLRSCRLRNNVAAGGGGGGIYNSDGALLLLWSCDMRNNRARAGTGAYGGGAM